MFWKIVAWLTLAGQAAILILSVQLYRLARTRSFGLLMCACICFVIAASSWFTIGFTAGFASGRDDPAARAAVFHLQECIDYGFRLVFVAVMILALLSFIRERRAGGKRRV